MTHLRIRSTEREGLAVITVEGGVDAFVVSRLKDSVSDYLERGVNRIVIDLEGVEQMNSTALGVIIGRLRRARSGGGDIRLANLNRRVREIFDVMGASKVFEIFDSVEDAAASFR